MTQCRSVDRLLDRRGVNRPSVTLSAITVCRELLGARTREDHKKRKGRPSHGSHDTLLELNSNSSGSYLAIDLGAESGRALLGRLRAGILTVTEIHRFANQPVRDSRALRWNVPRLWEEIRTALSLTKKVALNGVGVDAWGVDYALLGADGNLIENPYHYRDARTNGVMEQLFRLVPKEEIYSTTGIQFMPINTLFQLFAHLRDAPGILQAASKLLTIPDLFHFWLTGKAACEYTNASTTQMVNPVTRAWAGELMHRLNLPTALPAEIVESGSILGTLANSATSVIAPASHDTASAVAAISAHGSTAFLSSGTWSLVGTELSAPLINAETLRLNFTNEGGANGTTMLLKNVMGLWILQGCRRSWAAAGHEYPYADLMEAAAHEPGFRCLMDPDHEAFLNAEDMPKAIAQFCRSTDQPAPTSPGSFTRAVLESLALKYRLVIGNLEHVTGRAIEQIRVIGGGSKNRLLNQFTADATGRRVLAGPAEATALGNIAVQMIATGRAGSLKEAREIIDRSFPVETFEPHDTNSWDVAAARFQQYCDHT